MQRRISSSLSILVLIAVLAAPGVALAQRGGGNSGGGDRGGNSGGNSGSDNGAPERAGCLTAYCPPPPRPQPAVQQNESCDQVRVRERIPGTKRYHTVMRCRRDR